MSTASKSVNDCIAEIGELAELAAGILADARKLRDRVAELENDGMQIPATPWIACMQPLMRRHESWLPWPTTSMTGYRFEKEVPVNVGNARDATEGAQVDATVEFLILAVILLPLSPWGSPHTTEALIASVRSAVAQALDDDEFARRPWSPYLGTRGKGRR